MAIIRIPALCGTARRVRLGAVLLLFLLLSACSSTTFIYNRLDILLPWYLDDYVDITRDQRTSLDEWLKPFLHWHRVDELPHYVALLDNIEQSLDKPATAETVGQFYATLEQAWLRLEDRAMNWIFKLGADLGDEQIAEFLLVLQQQQEEYEDEFLPRTEEEYRQDSYQNFLDSLQDYLGRLDKNQRAVLREGSAELARMDVLWLEARAVWLVKLTELLQREPGWQQALRDAMAARNENHSKAYEQTYAHNLEVVQRVIATVLNSRSDKQDRRLRKKLNNLREDLQTLTSQGG